MTCGYLCPVCEGRGFTEDGSTCDWCRVEPKAAEKVVSDDEWIKEVHEGKCCGDEKACT